MARKFLLCVIFLFVLVNFANAAPNLYAVHQSITSMKDGHSDFSDARFFGVSLAVHDEDIQAEPRHVNAQGVITLSGGNYSWWTGKTMRENSGTSQSFTLITNSMTRGGDDWVFRENVSEFPDYMPTNLPPYGDAQSLATLHYVNFFYNADYGMNG